MTVTRSPDRVAPAPVARRFRPATGLVAGALGVLVTVSAATGLLAEDVYAGPVATAEMLRGYDAVALLVGPGLVLATRAALRGSLAAHLTAISLIGYLAYTYAYYLFGLGFTDVFLLHVAVFGTAAAALVLSLVDLDVASVAARFDGRPRTRAVAVLLGGLAAGLGGMWVYLAVDNAVTGAVPAGSRLVETDAVVHLGMALDLAVLVPVYAVAAVLLWRRAAWGFPLATIALVSGLLHQVSYVVAMPFQVAADVDGAVAFDPGEPLVVLAYAVAAALLLPGARARRGTR